MRPIPVVSQDISRGLQSHLIINGQVYRSVVCKKVQLRLHIIWQIVNVQ